MRVFFDEVKKETGRMVKKLLQENVEPLVLDGERIVFPKPVTLSITLINCGSEILLEGTIAAAGIVSCSRCLEAFLSDMEGQVCLEFRNADRLIRPSQIEAEAEESNDIRYYHEDDTYLDISQEIREILILSLPMKPLCREQCAGLCPLCGEDLNQSACRCRNSTEDPRFSILKQWSQT